ncbi:MAE_28990/MAE_18760 family HEPN-like nuclease [Enterobacter bugandensis]|uniref:MAE_28990/MAE_18760 family HEPN-like nuclease n=1 Tax=Enterobacter bugandensis TaxID=881260 RepID=UPI0023B04F91|nr:MAE_28990/MAE_18760 family HEPN-like nuclease [Enterobacter bugandensis]MDE7590887.1 MAE_28990/MAE_18760 family HEPN-like nuclease [Enterobacter bugandensis]
MANIDDAVNLSELYYQEISSTIEIRQAFQEILISYSQSIFPAISYDKELTDRYKGFLKLKTVDQSTLIKGLLIQSVAIYENFIREMVSVAIYKLTSSGTKYLELNLKLRNGFISSTGKVLTHYGSGTVNGVKYDFNNLTQSLISCLSSHEDYHIDSRVFTILLGNCTSSRIVSLFNVLGVSDNIFEDIKSDSGLKKHFNETRMSQVEEMTRNGLDELINLRNDIAHGDLTRAVSIDELERSIQFLRAFIKALSLKC